jgi:hypothetical protein
LQGVKPLSFLKYGIYSHTKAPVFLGHSTDGLKAVPLKAGLDQSFPSGPWFVNQESEINNRNLFYLS